MTEANKRALSLLQRIVTAEEFSELQVTGRISIPGGYVISRCNYVRRDREIFCVVFCVVFEDLPDIDNLILQYLLLKKDPRLFHRFANQLGS